MRDLLTVCLTSLLGWGAMGVERGVACWGEVCWGGVGICTGEEVGDVMRSLMRRRASWMSSRVGLITGFEDRQRSMRSCRPPPMLCNSSSSHHLDLLYIERLNGVKVFFTVFLNVIVAGHGHMVIFSTSISSQQL